MNEALIEQLKSDSVHARYGAVKALRRMGPGVIEMTLPLIVSPHEKDFSRLAALEVIRPFFSRICVAGLRALSSALPEMRSPALKIELIKLLALHRFVEGLPSIQMCMDDEGTDERIDGFNLALAEEQEYTVSTQAREAIRSLERSA